MQNNLLINGKLVAGEGETVPVFNPATGEEILSIAEATAAQVDAAVDAADQAFATWSQTTPKTRAECLLRLADVITDHAQSLAERLAAFSQLDSQEVTPIVLRAREKIATEFNQSVINKQLASLLHAL